eukprot:TRINITY_DN2229_c0_g1_i2.p1 TRINITY_DN2229_c0_g1~~TRINITY_DN2229_c0_g1_i2.p1  ORF type:complete len:203 (-),score=18.89 TRINITY_DN2229_c0_g1_i2:524-1132(-)
MNDVHTDDIREISINGDSIVSGGFDGKLISTDLNCGKSDCLLTVEGEVISSIRTGESSLLSFTTDDGSFVYFDPRINDIVNRRSFFEGLFSHDLVLDHGAYLIGAKGKYELLDFRMWDNVGGGVNPFVGDGGECEYADGTVVSFGTKGASSSILKECKGNFFDISYKRKYQMPIQSAYCVGGLFKDNVIIVDSLGKMTVSQM